MPNRTRKPRGPEETAYWLSLMLLAKLRRQSRDAVGKRSRVAVAAPASIADVASVPGIDQVEGRRLLRSFFALPQKERYAFLRQIEVASLRWRDPGPDQAPPVDDDDDWPAT